MGREAAEVLPRLFERLEQAARSFERGWSTENELLQEWLETLRGAAHDCSDGLMGRSPGTVRSVPIIATRTVAWAAERAWPEPGTATRLCELVGWWREYELGRHRRFAEAYEALAALRSLGDRALIAAELERLRLAATEADEDRLVEEVAFAAEHLGIWEALVAIISRVGPPLGIVGHNTATARRCLSRLAAVDAAAAAALEGLPAVGT